MADEKPVTPNGTAAPTVVMSADSYIRGLQADHGSDKAALRRAGKDNQKLRRKNAALMQELDGYKTRNPQGSVVLVGEDVTTWNEVKPVVVKLKEQGIKVADVPKVVKERDDLQEEKSKADTKSAARKAGEALGLKGGGLDLFEEVSGDKGLVFEEKDVTVMKGNKPVKEKRWHAKKAADDKASPVLVEDYPALKSYLKAFRAASTEEGDGDESAGSSADDSTEQVEEVSTVIPDQRSSGGKRKPKDMVKGYLTSQYPTPSELENGKKDKE